MLISQRLAEIDAKLKDIQTQDSTLYADIDRQLERIEATLTQDIKTTQKRLESKISDEAKEYQELTSKWLKTQLKDIQPHIQRDVERKAMEFLQSFKATLIQQVDATLQEEIREKTETLHTQIDIAQVIANLKQTESITTDIKERTSATLTETLMQRIPDIKQESINSLVKIAVQKINTQEVIKAALRTDTLRTAMTEEMQRQMRERIDTQMRGLSFKQDVDSIKNDFLSYINETKQNLHAYIQNLKQQSQHSLDTQADSYRETIKQVLIEFDSYIKAHKTAVFDNIIDAIVKSYDMQAVQSDAVERLLSQTQDMQDGIIQEASRLILETLAQETLLEHIMQDERLHDSIGQISLDFLEQKLDNVALKDYVTQSLKEKAKEILKDDELIRAEAIAAAHLAFIYTQSKLVDIQATLDSLKANYDLDAKIQELEAAKADLAQKQAQLETAKEEIKEALKKEFESVVVNDAMKKVLQDGLDKVMDDQNAEIQDLKAMIQTFISTQTQEMENLKRSIAQGTDGVDNKTFVWN